MNYKELITQEVQAFLMSKDVEVMTVEKAQDDTLTETQLMFAILIGNGKKGGLHISATLEKEWIREQLDAFFHVIQRQIMLYAIEAIKDGKRYNIPAPVLPDITQTIMFDSVSDAVNHHTSMQVMIARYDIFKNSYFNKKTKITK